MGVFDVAVVAILCSIVYKIVEAYLKHKGASVAEAELTQLKQEMTDMKQRLVTLERIVTDEGYDLKSKFENL